MGDGTVSAVGWNRIVGGCMKALTLWQPWASLMAIGWKEIETRGWSTDYRGPILIHAAQRMQQDQLILAGEPEFESLLTRLQIRTMHDLPLGAVVAAGHLTDCDDARTLLLERSRSGEGKPDEDLYGDFSDGRFGWLFEYVHALPLPVPARGQQALWTPSREVVSAVSASIGVRS